MGSKKKLFFTGTHQVPRGVTPAPRAVARYWGRTHFSPARINPELIGDYAEMFLKKKKCITCVIRIVIRFAIVCNRVK